MRDRDRIKLMEEANLRLENSYLKSKGLIKEEQPTLFPDEEMVDMIDHPDYKKKWTEDELRDSMEKGNNESADHQKMVDEIENKYGEEIEELIQRQLQIKDEIVRTYGEEGGHVFTDLTYWFESEYYGHDDDEEEEEEDEEPYVGNTGHDYDEYQDEPEGDDNNGPETFPD
jgi:uncharacterized protein YdcH (DUF465 family)